MTMLLLVSGATSTTRRFDVGELIVPDANNRPDSLKLTPGRWAMDNGAYSGFQAESFMRMLELFHRAHGCRFVSCPDVVGDAHATLERWPFWSRVIRGVGHIPALVLQDGMLAKEIPWREVGAVFVGGFMPWKLGPQASELCAYAKARGLWIHVGRVNSRRRVFEIARMGADSWDGGQYSMFPDTHIPSGLQDASDAIAQGRLL